MENQKIMDAVNVIREAIQPIRSEQSGAAIAMYCSLIEQVITYGVGDNDKKIENIIYANR